jgi:hypothetical protein
MNQSGYQDLLNNSTINADELVVGILNLPNLDANSVAYIDSSNNLSDILLNDGQLVVGKTGLAPVAASLTGTTSEVIVTNGPGTITLSTPQPIATTSSPTFSNITITGGVSGPTNSRTADNILSCSTSQTTNHLLSFTASQKVAQDSAINSADVFLRTGTVPMTGTLNLGNHDISNMDKIFSDLSNNNVLIGSGTTVTPGPANNIRNVAIGYQDSSTGFAIVEVGESNTQSGVQKCNLIGSGNGITGSFSSAYGDTNSISGSNSVAIGSGNTIGASFGFVLGNSATNNTANSILLGATNPVNIRPNGNNICDLGVTGTNVFKDIYANGSLIGGVKTSAIDSIVTGPASATSNNLCSFNSTTGKIIKDSGVLSTTVIVNTGSAVSGNIPEFGLVANTITDTGINAAYVVTNTSGGLATSNDICTFNGVSGTVIKDSGVLITDVVTGPASAVGDNLCSYNLTTGKIIKDSGISTTSITGGPFLPTAGGTMSGNIALATHNLTNVGNISGAVKTSAVDSIVTGPASAVGNNLCSYDLTTGKIIKDSGITTSSVSGGPFLPLGGGTMTGILDMGSHGITGISDLACISTASLIGSTNTRAVNNIVSNTGSATSGNVVFFSGTSGKVITDNSVIGGQLVKNPATTSVLNRIATFSDTTGTNIQDGGSTIAQLLALSGGTMTGTLAMGANNITGTGTVSANVFSAAATTDSTSSTTGAIICSGGVGIAKRLNIGTQCAIGVNRTTAISAFEVVGTGGINVTDGQAAASVKQLNLAYDTTNDRSVITSIHQGVAFTDIEFDCGNIGFFTAPSAGGGSNVIFIKNAATVPTTNPTGGGILYVTGGALKYRGSGGTVTNIAAA